MGDEDMSRRILHSSREQRKGDTFWRCLGVSYGFHSNQKSIGKGGRRERQWMGRERVEDEMINQVILRDLVECAYKRAISRHYSVSWNLVGLKENKQHWIHWACLVVTWLYLPAVLKYHISNKGFSTAQKEEKAIWPTGWGAWDSYKIFCCYRKATEEIQERHRFKEKEENLKKTSLKSCKVRIMILLWCSEFTQIPGVFLPITTMPPTLWGPTRLHFNSSVIPFLVSRMLIK